MSAGATQQVAVWAVAALAIGGVIVRPWRLPEAASALAGALAMVAFGLLAPAAALHAVWRGLDVYLFLAGMMLLAELARHEGLFDWLATHAVSLAKGSASRLFVLVYGIGVAVTVSMSNDATAVVLTPAVYAVAKRAGARPLPYLFACAMVANAASFVLPISNPANLVVFGSQPPRLLDWLARFGWPSLVAVLATYGVLRWWFRHVLAGRIDSGVVAGAALPTLSRGGRTVGWGIAAVALVLMAASALHRQLGAPTLLAATAVTALVCVGQRRSPASTLRAVSWGVLLLVAGLFVLVQALETTGVVAALARRLHDLATTSPALAAWGSGVLVALLGNLMNNLPAGLLAASVLTAAPAEPLIRSAVMIGIDLGPNLSVTGSLATILWLDAIRREGDHVSAWTFLKVGAVAMPAALLPALAALFI